MSDVTDFLSAWCAAERDRDTAFLATHLTDDFVGVGPLGFTLPKPAWIGRHQGDDLRYETFALDEIAVRSYGPVTLVTARQDADGTFQGNPVPQSLRNTMLLVANDDGAWQLASIHMSFIAGTPGAPPIPGMPPPTPPTD
jgi:ketosteroid isomerase-like protein